MTHVTTRITIHAPADAVWQTISDFGAACHYLTGVVNCTVAGTGVGALRTLTNADGTDAIVERLDELDQDAHRLSYALLTDTPFGSCLTTMNVQDLSQEQCELEWSATFQAKGIPASEAQEMLEGALAANCISLKQFMEASRK